MRTIDAAAVASVLTPQRLVPLLEAMFREGCETPTRHHHTIPVPASAAATLLLMPAWQAGRYIGTKLVTVFPSNAALHLPTVSAGYLLMDGKTGSVLALIDGAELTAKRTAAASALAARFLTRPKAESLLIVGTGRIAKELARSHLATRPRLRTVALWGRSSAKATDAARELAASGITATVVTDLPRAVAQADLVSVATLAHTPLILGKDVRAGTHVDLVGGFTPEMREGDDDLIVKARVFVDTHAALAEAGDLVVPLNRGLLDAAAVVDLATLCRDTHAGRQNDTEITLFKSVGTALEDLAAAIAVYESI